ncbi:MAG TPA: hypothetical protein DHV16_11195, partial [Nitrospiraceae bacterium]|nr:hypothetical protein [Nitrospiraceae bacterium]
RARGLKLFVFTRRFSLWLSRPSRARGLKLTAVGTAAIGAVAPLAGAWIETSRSQAKSIS